MEKRKNKVNGRQITGSMEPMGVQWDFRVAAGLLHISVRIRTIYEARFQGGKSKARQKEKKRE